MTAGPVDAEYCQNIVDRLYLVDGLYHLSSRIIKGDAAKVSIRSDWRGIVVWEVHG